MGPGAASSSFNYRWTISGVDVSDQAEADFPADGPYTWFEAQSMDARLTVTDGCGARTQVWYSGDGWQNLPSGLPDEPTVSIEETDTGGMVFEGDAATFVISIDHAVDHDVMVDYTTVDGTGASGATAVSDYASTHGPREAVIVAGDTEATIYDSEFAALQVSTTGGIDGGGDKQFLVKLSNPNECQLGANSSATATIVRPEVDITSPDESSGTIDVSAGIGGRTEVDLQAKVDPAYAASGDTGFQLTVPDGAENLTF